MTDEAEELTRVLRQKIEEIVRLLDRVRAHDGTRAPDFMMGLDAGIVIGRLQAELKRRLP